MNLSFDDVQTYISQNHLVNAQKALILMEDYLEDHSEQISDSKRIRHNIEHVLYIVRILIDLNPPYDKQDIDLMITVTLCHPLAETSAFAGDPYDLMKSYGISEEVCKLMHLIDGRHTLNDEGLAAYCLRIRENPMALMVVLADCGRVLQELHTVSSWKARRHIYEIRSFYMPMCIYAKEAFPELLPCLGILMGKMRTLVELAEMMLNRYEPQEMELIQDILAMREENATIKGILRRLQAEKKAESLINHSF